MRQIISAACAFLLASLLLSAGAGAATILLDDFNDNALDPAWAVSLTNASSYTAAEAGGEYAVSYIKPRTGGAWSEVKLSRTFAPLADFHLDFDFSWLANDITEMQYVFVRLYDTANKLIAMGGYNDSWTAYAGHRFIRAGANYTGGPGTPATELPLSGSSAISISRDADLLTTEWLYPDSASGGSVTDTITGALSRMDITFGYYPYPGSTFGRHSVSHVHLQDTPAPVPEPGTLALLGAGIAALCALRLGKKG